MAHSGARAALTCLHGSDERQREMQRASARSRSRSYDRHDRARAAHAGPPATDDADDAARADALWPGSRPIPTRSSPVSTAPDRMTPLTGCPGLTAVTAHPGRSPVRGPGHGCVSRSTTEPEGNRRRERSRERGADLPARRPGRGGGQRVLRRAGRPQRAVAADPGAAQQARSRRRRRARYRMDPSRIGRVRRGQHRRDQEPVRGAGGPAVTGRAATACTRAAAVVRQVRRADTAARRRQRRAEAMPFLQADSPRQPSWVERRSPHGGRCGAVITALPICSRAGGGREAL